DSARRWAPVLANFLDLGSAKSLLLLGDGPAVHAHHFARTHPRLAITVLDTPASVAVGREYLAGKAEAARIRLVPGDPLRDDLPEGRFSAAFLSDALHSFSLEDARRLLRRVRRSLKAGGLLVVRDRFLDDRGPGPLENALYDVQLLLTTREGRCHSLKEVEAAVRAAGFGKIRAADPGLSDPTRILTARA
ncbi:MAG: methyltransferase domain-containing protein, partial [Planctomycetaceae bacterium]|nr:methyltransferase domain-containing protein [Planctomycetaceae bacterium]